MAATKKYTVVAPLIRVPGKQPTDRGKLYRKGEQLSASDLGDYEARFKDGGSVVETSEAKESAPASGPAPVPAAGSSSPTDS